MAHGSRHDCTPVWAQAVLGCIAHRLEQTYLLLFVAYKIR
jgi:hypothetical protein